MKNFFFRFILVFLTFVCFFLGILLFLPDPDNFQTREESSKIYDRNGELLYEILIPEKGKQDFVEIEKISPYLVEAIIAIEDQDFYEHFGIDFSAILRAFGQNLYYGEVISGASTIEQQLARNLLNHQERTYLNKLKEIALALKLNFKYNKNELLEKYLNTVYFGNLAYGIETAAQTYFGKTSEKLDLAESAFLAGLPQSPSKFSPYVDLSAGINRHSKVLEALLVQQKISQEDYEIAKEEELIFQKQKLVNIKAPHFVMWILDKLEKDALLEEIAKGGYKITTTLDLALQDGIQNLANLHLEKLVSQNITNAAVVVLDQNSGEVLAMLGSRDYFDESIDGEVNVALALRQPGSTLKPFLYAMAFENGLNPKTTIIDEAVQFDSADGHPYEPKNYDLKYHGEVTLREALAQSLNIPAVKILDFIGVNAFLNKLRDLGISTLNYPAEHYGLSIALGSGEVSLLDLTRAYGVLGNTGGKIGFSGINTIQKNASSPAIRRGEESRDLKISPFRFTPVEMTQSVLEEKAVNQVTSILSDNYSRIPAFGEDNPLKFNYPVAAKTGTSRNFRDNWTLGYTPNLTVGVWVGNNDGSPMIDSSGITGSAPLFHSVMDLVMLNLPKESFEKIEEKNEQTSFQDFVNLKKLTKIIDDDHQRLISYPYDGDVFQLSLDIPLEKQALTFKAKEKGGWYLNEDLLGLGETIDWQMQRGEYSLSFKAEEEETIFFIVQ